MAFLDNSGDIILDAVLTDAGRRRLAQGDGSFRISKFAFGDDEINYGLYDKNNASGSAYYDLEILQTPIFEAFTNNGSSMKSKVLTITNPNLLYLPIIKLNENASFLERRDAGTFGADTYLIASDKATRDVVVTAPKGVIFGDSDSGDDPDGSLIRLDQGLDTTSRDPSSALPADLREDTFVVELDNRLGTIVARDDTEATPSNIDDDNIATYIFSRGVNEEFVKDIASTANTGINNCIAGPRGNKIAFRVKATIDLANSNYYFDLFGSTDAAATVGSMSTTAVKFIDSIVTVYGASTGYNVQIPIRYFKKS